MGSFSWLRADRSTKRKNIAKGDPYKVLIPKEFGGGYIKDVYHNYGMISLGEGKEEADLFGILAYWNKCEGMTYNSDTYPSTMADILEYGRTYLQSNRYAGIEIGTYKEDIDKLKYPLKLVSASYKETYEECDGVSYTDPDQGFYKTYWILKDFSKK